MAENVADWMHPAELPLDAAEAATPTTPDTIREQQLSDRVGVDRWMPMDPQPPSSL